MATSEADMNRQNDDSHVTAQQWKWTALAGMASYIDAGSIVALAAGLALWEEYLGLSSTTLGLLAALGPNAFGAAIGALIGGRLGDLFGRKRIYQYDLLVYALGTLLIVFSVNLPMLLIGTFIVGVAVGADVPTLAAIVFTLTIYLFWNLAAGTFGVFTPSLLKNLGAQSQAASVALSCAGFVITLVAVVLIFMPFSDRSDRARRIMWGVGAVMNVAAVAQLLIFPLNTVTAIALITLFGIGAALAGEPFYKTWSQELFPTMLRTTAQGVTFGIARFLLGIWSFFVPVLASLSIRPVALILMIFLIISGVVGYVFMPNTAGKSLEEIEAERSGRPATEQVPA